MASGANINSYVEGTGGDYTLSSLLLHVASATLQNHTKADTENVDPLGCTGTRYMIMYIYQLDLDSDVLAALPGLSHTDSMAMHGLLCAR